MFKWVYVNNGLHVQVHSCQRSTFKWVYVNNVNHVNVDKNVLEHVNHY